MYQLILTLAERQAIDWVGNRYAHGHDLYRLLWVESNPAPDVDWDSDCEITFAIPEHVAWQIAEMGAECNYLWDCFSEELSAKLTDFCLTTV